MKPSLAGVWGFDWEELLLYIREGRVIPVVGRDALLIEHDGQTITTDRWLALRLADRLRVHPNDVADDATLADVAFRYIRKNRRRQTVYSRLKTILEEEHIPTPEPLRKLAAIWGFSFFVSTTVDELLDRALNEVRYGGEPGTKKYSYSPFQTLQDIPLDRSRLDETTVYRLFGTATPVPDYAVTEEDHLEYLHHLQRRQRRPHALFDLLSESQLLLIGCRFPDWLARFFVRTIRTERLIDQHETTELVVDDHITKDEALLRFLTQYDTQFYLPGGVAQFTEELHDRWTSKYGLERPAEEAESGAPTAAGSPPAGEPRTAPMMPEGAVFLSYANEDKTAALRLSDALEGVGLDVWLDLDDLEPGSAWDDDIQRNVRRCAAFIPVISSSAANRQEGYFRFEWNLGLTRSLRMAPTTRFVWPVLLDETSAEHEGIPQELGRFQWAPITQENELASFVEEIRDEIRRARAPEYQY